MSNVPTFWAALSLCAFRVGGFMVVAPLFSARTVPSLVRASIAVLLTALLLPVVMLYPMPPALGPRAFGAEMIVGMGIGMGAATLLAGAELAGDVLAVQTGLSGATALDPLTGVGTGVLGHFLGLLALALMLASGAHLVMIEALASSYDIVAPAGGIDLRAGAAEVLRSAGLLFAQGLQFAAPIVAAVSVGYVALGVLARTSPQLNMLAVAFPLQIGLGLIMLALLLPVAATFYAGWPAHVETLARRFLIAIGGF